MSVKKSNRQSYLPWIAGVLALVTVGAMILWGSEKVDSIARIDKPAIAAALAKTGVDHRFPTELNIEASDGSKHDVVLQYAFDRDLQETVRKAFRSYRPDYGAFVAIDANSGRVLSAVSYSRFGWIRGNLTLRASYPAASVFKMVTAAAVIGEKNLSAETVIPFNGRSHTLYRRNVVETKINRWTRFMSLKDAFSKSINTVFGKLGAFTLLPEDLREYAGRFQFNRSIASDLPVEAGRASIREDLWSRIEAASGFTRENTMSPFQGAVMAAIVSNNGVMVEPYAISSVHETDGTELYRALPPKKKIALDSSTAFELRKLMRRTVTNGTVRGTFRGFKRRFDHVEVGGKTGTLTGMNPYGKHDWFVGYANHGGQRLAMAVLTVNERLWRVKSARVARIAIEKFYGRRVVQ